MKQHGVTILKLHTTQGRGDDDEQIILINYMTEENLFVNIDSLL